MAFWDFKRSPASVDLIVAFGRDLGLSPAALLRGSGISRAQLTDPNVDISALKELKVTANLLRLSGAPPRLGLGLGLRYGFTCYGFWGYGLIASATAADALALALRHLPLTYAFTHISSQREGDRVLLNFEPPDFDDELKRLVVERDMVAAATLLHELAGEHFALQSLQLGVPASTRKVATLAMPTRVFGIAPVYGAARSQLSFDAAFLARRLPGANPITAAACEQFCAELVRRRQGHASTSETVRQYLAIPGVRLPDLVTMARHLNTSERTLKRRLHDEGTSFRLLLESRRRALARELLRDRELSLGAIAERLGFADLSSFSQAHKRWHGVSPKAAR
ncbi:AraC family transcriptional regulator [Solimonas marina]|uniref:AraC family transcriptional regulator n=1 Tax=Solimonas marina TaxID=2714601 RepID=A0A969W7H1_9GAMM|nr:AraC family transcriptional regulator [Solimonas marina]NKF22106.1 AraC family transcriptional regulator [Solimonas marina]